MKIELARGDERFDVDVHELGQGRARVRVTRLEPDGRTGESPARELEVHVVVRGAQGLVLTHGDDVVSALVERRGSVLRVHRAAAVVELAVLDPLRPVAGKAGAAASGPVRVSAPIPGRVLKLPVAVGEDVAEGQAVAVIEAMKMANELRSPIAGRVTTLHVVAGATVEAGAPLVTVSPR